MKAFDERWDQEFATLGAFPIQNYLQYDPRNVSEERAKFMAGETENPLFIYPLVKTVDIQKIEDDLVGLRERIDNEEDNQWVRLAYLDRIDEKLIELEQLKAVRANNDDQFDLSMSRLYGEIDKGLFSDVLRAFEERLNDDLASSSRASDAVEKLNDIISSISKELETSNRREEGVFTYVYKQDAEYLNATEIREVFNGELERHGISGWKVVVDNAKRYKSITVNQNERSIFIPTARKLTLQESRALAEHELVHIRRRLNGDVSGLKILGRGLAYYLRAEEGIAKRIELEFSRSALNATLENYLLSGLIMGVDGKKRSFREIYDVSALLFEAVHLREVKNNNRSVRGFAWPRAMRFFRGTSGQTPGVCQRRYKTYLEGFVAVDSMFSSGSLEESVAMVGKYDPSNERHVAILKGLNII